MIKKFTHICVIIFLFTIANSALAENSLQYEIQGVSDAVKQNIIARLTSDQQRYPKPLTEPAIQELFEKSADTVKSAMQPFGYFKVTILEQGLDHPKQDRWIMIFRIQPGPELRITKLDVKLTGEGQYTEPFRTLMQELPLKQGEPLLMENYNTAKNKFTNLAAENGYLSGKLIKHTIYIDLEKYTSSVVLHFDTGPQYYFGKVTFENTTYDPDFLQRFVQFEPGADYSAEALLKLQQDLHSTVYFRKVSVHPAEHESRELQVPITVHIDARKGQHYKLGAGFGTDTGVRGTLNWDWRHLTDTGHYMQSQIQASQIQSNLHMRYVIPGKNPITDQYFFGGSIEEQHPNDSDGHTQKVTIGKIDRWHDWQRTLTLNYQWDQYNIRKDPKERTNLLLPNINLLRSRMDNVLFPRNGNRIAFNIRGASRRVLSNSSFTQADVDARYITSPWKKTRILLRGDVGYTAANEIERVPLSLQYFAGGAQSIRGYKYQELGPGRYLLVLSSEFQYEIKDKWFLATFVDAGNAVNSLTNPKNKAIGRKLPNVNLSDLLKYSAGVGIVVVTPVGPVELTIAKPLTDSHKRPRLQFTMGSNL